MHRRGSQGVRVRSRGAGEAGWGHEWGQPRGEADRAPGVTLILLGTHPEGLACSGGRPHADGVPLFTGVQSAAVNVICELARRNPKNYLSLAPLFFKLMTSSTNNWVLIKIIKLASVAPGVSWACQPAEPRAAVPPLLRVTTGLSCPLVWCSDPLGAKVG